MFVFTSVINNYLPKARVLCKTLKKFHPDWKFAVVISEPLHDTVKPEEEPFDMILTLSNLEIPDLENWIFKHNIMEVCTAVKGSAAIKIAELSRTDKIIYLDPDIAVFNSLQEISDLLDEHPVLLTPHQTKPGTAYNDILINEVCFLKHGVFNLGFFAVHCEGQGIDFLRWYADRLIDFCYIDIEMGLFTDQKWCDLAPILFNRLFIISNPGYNVARWNLSQRKLSKDTDGNYLADGVSLLFFHFSGYDSGQGLREIGRFAETDNLVHELWNWYEEILIVNGQNDIGKTEWKYSYFSSGNRITPVMKHLYRLRKDLQDAFPDPFTTNDTVHCFENWYQYEHPRET